MDAMRFMGSPSIFLPLTAPLNRQPQPQPCAGYGLHGSGVALDGPAMECGPRPAAFQYQRL